MNPANPETQRGDKSKASGRGTDANRDPISKKPGAHPVGTGVGAAAGGVAGVAGAVAATVATGAAGTLVGGPVGGAAALAAGALAGGLAGKAIAEKIDPTVEDSYWRESYTREPYYQSSYSYDDYGPAYRTGYEGYAQYNARSFEDSERELEVDYNRNRGKSRLEWNDAKQATRSAWDRVRSAVGSDDRDTSRH